MISEEIKKSLRRAVGAENVLDSDIDRFGYSYDSSSMPILPAYKPDVVVLPTTAEEVSKVMAIAFAHGIPVTPRGAASNRTGGSVPLEGGIVLSLDRMTKILELDEDNMMVTTEPGVRTIDLYNYCAAKGLFFPPDPASWKVSTIGGNIAENAGGMRAVKYGVVSDYVMALEVVLADGTILNTGGKAIKNVTGYDLKHLFTGSEGTLGIITKATLKLIPMPKQRGTLQIMFKSLDAACATIQKMLQENIVPAAAEVMDKTSLDIVSKKRKVILDPVIESCAIIEIDGEDQDALDAQAKRIEAVASALGAVNFQVAQSQSESDELWAMRRGLSQAVAALAPNRIGEDIAVPRGSFPEVVRRIKKLGEKYDLTIVVYGHAGDGNLHPTVLCDYTDAELMERVHKAIDGIFEAALAVGGTLSGEHGIGISKKPYIVQALGQAGVETMKVIKQALDPKGILNPGKIW
ncbi:MAG: FAD-linked oxidase C-terminal domain-containing protein [Sporomusaceae bacterium]|nr:FAD-linked oxidase C-terminal domain-containing protein [Sporomusaceae bacterium]